MKINLRKAVMKDISPIKKLCVDTIRNSCTKEYSPEQLDVWISSVIYREWANSIKTHHFIIAELENEIVGFGSIENGEFIAYLYVSNRHLRMGIAERIFENLMEELKRMGKKTIWSNVSKTAKPFFIKKGFSIVKLNTNLLNGVLIENYRMVKKVK